MGIDRSGLNKRKATGGKRHLHVKKRRYNRGRQPAMTKLVPGTRRVRGIRTRGGHMKWRALRLDSGNFAWGSEGISKLTRILDVLYSPANAEYVRTKTLVKSCIVAVDATPFRNWYYKYYGVQLGEKTKHAARQQGGKLGKKKLKQEAAKMKKEEAQRKGREGKAKAEKESKAKADKEAKDKKAAESKKSETKSDKKSSEKKKSEKKANKKSSAKKEEETPVRKVKIMKPGKPKNLVKKGGVMKGGKTRHSHLWEKHGKYGLRRLGSTQPPQKGSKTLKNKWKKRASQKGHIIKNVEEQFLNNQGRLLARISSRPGRVGRADGYILEGEELDFYIKKMEKKKKKR